MLYQKTHFSATSNKTGSVREQRVNPDLLEERAKCAFDKNEMMETMIYGPMLETVKSFASDLEKYPELRTDHTYFDMTRDEQIKFWWEKLNHMYRINKEKYFFNWRGGAFSYTYCHPGVSPLFLHYQMFQIAVDRLASDEQRAKWMPKINTL
jgi:acyl-CoA oxidase